MNMKKLRATAATGGYVASFTGVVEVIFAPQGDLWRCIDVKSALTLVCVCRATRSSLQKWVEAYVADISLGKETRPVPVQLPLTNFHAKLHAVLQLMTFTYITTVRLPVVSELPPHLLTKQQDDEHCQRVLRGRQVEVILSQCKGKGWGVLAAQQIEKGAFVGEYTGELISSREMQRRYRELYDPQEINYVLSLREHVAQQGLHFDIVRTNVDATYTGNLTRFFNHSCSPSLKIEAVRVDSFVPRLALFARRYIEVGEELTFDYGEGASGVEKIRGTSLCCCGAPECRGYLPYRNA